MNREQIEKLDMIKGELMVAFDVHELSDCAYELSTILQSERESADAKTVECLKKAQLALDNVLIAFEEYEIGGAFAAMVGNNSELRALFKENVHTAIVCIDQILKQNK